VVHDDDDERRRRRARARARLPVVVGVPLHDGVGRVVAANELHIPVGVSVDLALEAHDVIHSFWYPSSTGRPT